MSQEGKRAFSAVELEAAAAGELEQVKQEEVEPAAKVAKIEDETGMDHAVAASSSSSSSSSSSAAPAFFTGPMAQPQGVKKEDEDDGESVTIGGVGVQKKKVALRLAYVGKAYMGMQINPGAKTIEAELQKSMIEAGAISEANADKLTKVSFVRAARTDKGVHAAGQIVSFKMLMQPNIIDRINEKLPSDIRAMGYCRVVGGFNAKNDCYCRVYEYFMPTFMFMPGNANPYFDTKHPKLFPEAAKNYKDALAALAAASAAPAASAEGTASEEPGAAAAADPAPAPQHQNKKKKKGGNDDEEGEGEEVPEVFSPELVQSQKLAKVFDTLRSAADVEKEKLARQQFRMSPEQLAKLQRILDLYQGTHNYHNYTSGKRFEEESAKRFMMWFKASPVQVFDGIEWIALRVQGQSFMLHQIRKMVGMAIGVMRTGGDEKIVIPRTFERGRVNIPRAPGAGLFLDEIKFDGYNRKLQKLGNPQPPIAWDSIQPEIDAFKRDHIYRSIIEDGNQGAFLEFLMCIDFFDESLKHLRKQASVADAEDATGAQASGAAPPPPAEAATA